MNTNNDYFSYFAFIINDFSFTGLMNFHAVSQDTYPRCRRFLDCISYCARVFGIPFCISKHCFCLRRGEKIVSPVPSEFYRGFDTNGVEVHGKVLDKPKN